MSFKHSEKILPLKWKISEIKYLPEFYLFLFNLTVIVWNSVSPSTFISKFEKSHCAQRLYLRTACAYTKHDHWSLVITDDQWHPQEYSSGGSPWKKVWSALCRFGGSSQTLKKFKKFERKKLKNIARGKFVKTREIISKLWENLCEKL